MLIQVMRCSMTVQQAGQDSLPVITEQPNVGGVFYNQDLFEEQGVEVPTTWTEFLDVCKALKDKGIQPLALDSTYAPFLFGLSSCKIHR